MNQNSPDELLAALAAERAALAGFVTLLEHEQEMLVENRTDPLLALSGQKTGAALALHELAETRRSLLRQHIPQPTADSANAWLARHSQEGLANWQEMLTLAKRAQQLNRTNGELVHMKLRHNQQAFAVLSNAVNRVHLYGPNGHPSFTPGSGRSLGRG